MLLPTVRSSVVTIARLHSVVRLVYFDFNVAEAAIARRILRRISNRILVAQFVLYFFEHFAEWMFVAHAEHLAARRFRHFLEFAFTAAAETHARTRIKGAVHIVDAEDD